MLMNTSASGHAPRVVNRVLSWSAAAGQSRTAADVCPASYAFTGVMDGFATGTAVRPKNGRTSVRGGNPPI
jgi:hypothetical protein